MKNEDISELSNQKNVKNSKQIQINSSKLKVNSMISDSGKDHPK